VYSMCVPHCHAAEQTKARGERYYQLPAARAAHGEVESESSNKYAAYDMCICVNYYKYIHIADDICILYIMISTSTNLHAYGACAWHTGGGSGLARKQAAIGRGSRRRPPPPPQAQAP